MKMAGDITILHNPRCSTSRFAVQAAEDAGAGAQVRNYRNDPLTESEWLEVLAILEGEPTELVRRDQNFKASGLGDGDVATAEQVAKVLAEIGRASRRERGYRTGCRR